MNRYRQWFSSAAIAGLMTWAVKGVAFLKELVVAREFGTADEVEIFALAVTVPAAAGVAVGGAFHDCMIPYYSQRRITRPEEARQIVANTLWYALVFLIALSLVLVVFRNEVIEAMGGRGSFRLEKRNASAVLLPWLAPYLIAVSLSHVIRGYLRSHDRMVISSLSPVLIPLSVMAMLCLAPGKPNETSLALGTSIGAVLGLAVLAAESGRAGSIWLAPRRDQAGNAILKAALPLMGAVAVFESYTVIDTMMAARLERGSVAILGYGERTSGVFILGGTAVIAALMPKISDLAAKKDWAGYRRLTFGIAGMILLCSIPVVLFFGLASEWVVKLLFERGKFTGEDTRNVAAVLRLAAFQIPAYNLSVLGAKMVTSLLRPGIVMKVTLLGFGLNILLNFLLMQWLGLKGIVLATSVVQTVSAVIFFAASERMVGKRLGEGQS